MSLITKNLTGQIISRYTIKVYQGKYHQLYDLNNLVGFIAFFPLEYRPPLNFFLCSWIIYHPGDWKLYKECDWDYTRNEERSKEKKKFLRAQNLDNNFRYFLPDKPDGSWSDVCTFAQLNFTSPKLGIRRSQIEFPAAVCGACAVPQTGFHAEKY